MAAPEENKNALTHGIHSFEAGGERNLSPFEVESLQELRELVKTEQGRQDVKLEIIARLVIIARKLFADMQKSQNSRDWWEGGPVIRGGTYLAELRRWLEIFEPPRKTDSVDVILRAIQEAQDDGKDQ